MSQRPLRASAISFAHLLGIGASAAKAQGDETPPKDAKNGGAKAEEVEELDEDGNPIKRDPEEGVNGEPTPDLTDVEDPDDSIDEDAAPEEDDVDPKLKKAAKSGRKAERGRWTKVMGHSSAAGRVASACQLLSTTTMSSRAIVNTLKTLPAETATPSAQRGSGLRERMAQAPAPRLGSDGGKSSADQTFGEQVAAAVSKVRTPQARR